MQVITTVAETNVAMDAVRADGRKVGLVPTMGALHAGHTSLIRAACQETDFVVVSIFVNPRQFGPNEDLDRYPRPLENDLQLCAAEGVDLVFHPSPSEMYLPGSCTYVEVHGLQDVLCGAARPGHFRGVATVVLKLFSIVGPDVAFFGQKDAQQARLIAQMIDDLNLPVRLRICPTVREPDGLALSSRNQYLDSDQRQQAVALFQALEAARQTIEAGERNAGAVLRILGQRIEAAPAARVDYLAVVDHVTLKPVLRLEGTVLVAVAVYFGSTRLIDNLIMDL
jgi:pantoate--beta-alanine ligase